MALTLRVLRHALPEDSDRFADECAEDVGPTLVSLFRIDAVLTKANGLADLGAQVKRLLTDRTDDVRDSARTMRSRSAVRGRTLRWRTFSRLMLLRFEPHVV